MRFTIPIQEKNPQTIRRIVCPGITTPRIGKASTRLLRKIIT